MPVAPLAALTGRASILRFAPRAGNVGRLSLLLALAVLGACAPAARCPRPAFLYTERTHHGDQLRERPVYGCPDNGGSYPTR